jgi:hypothetical protein
MDWLPANSCSAANQFGWAVGNASGGGYERHGMSDTTFLWMLSELRDLLGFDEDNVVRSLDNNVDERFPGGKLEDSRTLFWKLIFCPVPRPVGVISATEHVHASAWERGQAAVPLVPAGDIYKTGRRRDWLAGITALRVARSALETEFAGAPRHADPPPVDIRPKIGLCGYVLKYFNPQG